MQRDAMPATDGASIWLPQSLGIADHDRAFTLYKAMALLQAARIHRGSASVGWRDLTPLAGALYRLIEAHACERHVLAELPGFAGAITALRAECLVRRPPRHPSPHRCGRWMPAPDGCWPGKHLASPARQSPVSR